MAKAKRGKPCWYELSTTDPDGAASFYGRVLGWQVADAGMPGFDYRIAKSGDDMVAGMMAPQGQNTEPLWMVYATVTDCDKAAKAIAKAGGAVRQEPTDIPDTGRFAIVADPQGAAIGILQPLEDDSNAFDQDKPGHAQWQELMTSDPKAAMEFYGKHFGWKPADSMDMGPGGSYDMFRHGKTDIGGMMKQAPGMPGPKRPFWLPYFGTDGIEAAIGRTNEAGGKVIHGPMEIPGGAFIMVGNDPQGALFALVGPK
ncbi:Putative glyoxylase CFP32 [Defluviimonas aquaemixtae]|uniref:Glyoxylase CFP32 n=1 Tax=Albidovulum aquaemixtae TaxID=1542388 RepID=A0A2R8BMM3_9RHOB|nr:VOC family protein [Defluviimonas aquaemixtae]SPH24685.1 Putative glyoxylase CFP32 [Defluviimonas aquaemixtae]